jgi:hypothetical protein
MGVHHGLASHQTIIDAYIETIGAKISINA